MTTGWALGVGANSRFFANDRVANALRNSPGVITARERFYKLNKSHYDYDFGVSGLKNARLNPIEQFVGSYSVDVSANLEGGFLQFTITNLTSLYSADYHTTPQNWNISPGYPMGDFNQGFIFTEHLRQSSR